jgi:hypothetical protein
MAFAMISVSMTGHSLSPKTSYAGVRITHLSSQPKRTTPSAILLVQHGLMKSAVVTEYTDMCL